MSGANGSAAGPSLDEQVQRVKEMVREAEGAFRKDIHYVEDLYMRAAARLKQYDEKGYYQRAELWEKVKKFRGDPNAPPPPGHAPLPLSMQDAISLLTWGVHQLAERVIALEQRDAGSKGDAELGKRIAALEQGDAEREKRLSGLSELVHKSPVREHEGGPLLFDGGIWREDTIYLPGAVVTDHGSAWLCQKQTNKGERPGQSKAWRLMVKRGAHGRDAR